MACRHQMALSLAAVVLLVTASRVHGGSQHESRSGFGGRVVGGTSASIHKFPWMVSLERGGQHHCGGSVLSERWVLTAAQCFDGGQEVAVRSCSNTTRRGGLVRSVKTTILHEHYDPADGTADYDIAVLEVEEPFQWSDRLQPIPGLASEDPAPGTRVVVTGWGEVAYLGSKSSDLQEVAMSVVDWKQCRRIYKAASKDYVTRTKICTLELGKGDCHGDSGGPVVDEQTRVQVGIVSTGHECANEFPNLETSVAHFREWIKEKTGV